MHYVNGVLMVLCAMWLWGNDAAWAGSFKVVPIKIYFEDADKVRTVLLQNESDADVTLQFEAVVWRQDEQAKDLYEPTKALFIFPGIVTVKAKGDKTIKLGYKGPPADAQERTFRVYMTELPISKQGEATLQMAMRLSVPVFIVPKKGRPEVEIERANVSKGTVDVQVTNPGNRHIYVKTIQVTGLDEADKELFTHESAGWYVLPGVHRTFSIPLLPDQCNAGQKLRVSVKYANRDVDQTPVTITQPMDRAACRVNAASAP